MELPIYKSVTPAITAPAQNVFSVQSSIISPNAIPDRVILAVRKQVNTQLVTDNEYYYPITSVNITWGTQSGILASCTKQDLYYYSKKAGLNMTFNQFGGSATLLPIAPATSATVNNVGTTGGLVILDFCDVIPIIEDYYTSSSLGNWTFSVSVTCNNAVADTNVPPTELLVCFVNSGVFQSTSGSSSQYIGVLSKDEVLRVSQERPVMRSEDRRLVGAGFMNSIKSALPSLSSVFNIIPSLAKTLLKEEGHSKLAKAGVGALEALGYGRPRVR
jgi:hypothetical protein